MNNIEEFEKAYRWLEGEMSSPTYPEWGGYFRKCIENLYEEPIFVEDKGMNISMEWGIRFDTVRNMTLAVVQYIVDVSGEEIYGYCPVLSHAGPTTSAVLIGEPLERQKCRVLERVYSKGM